MYRLTKPVKWHPRNRAVFRGMCLVGKNIFLNRCIEDVSYRFWIFRLTKYPHGLGDNGLQRHIIVFQYAVFVLNGVAHLIYGHIASFVGNLGGNDYGFAGIKKDGKWGSIDIKGNVVQEPTYNLDEYLLIDFIGRWHLGQDINMNYYNQL